MWHYLVPQARGAQLQAWFRALERSVAMDDVVLGQLQAQAGEACSAFARLAAELVAQVRGCCTVCGVLACLRIQICMWQADALRTVCPLTCMHAAVMLQVTLAGSSCP